MAKTKYEIAQIIQKFLPEIKQQGGLSGHQISTLNLLAVCKTSALGGHKERCDCCGHTRIHYNSCGNRNCPICQAVNKEKWIFDRQHDLLPVKYFHCVFTVPSELYDYFRYNKKLLYDLLFKATKETLLTLGLDPKRGIGGKIGGIGILHTWTQQMGFHPHVHYIIPAGGLDGKDRWKHAKSKGNYLFPARVMSKLFRGKFMAQLHKFYQNGQLNLSPKLAAGYHLMKSRVYTKDWVAYAKKAFGGPTQVLEYLGRYTHKICISNYRILKITDTHVTFRYLNRKVNKVQYKKVTGGDFIRLFAAHILPKGFVKIRHFGILSSRTKKETLAMARKSLCVQPSPPKVKMTTREFMIMTTGKDPYACPLCKKGEMVVIATLPAIRGSPVKPPMRFFAKDKKIALV